MAPYRPSGRSNRSNRAQADNEIFEGLPVKQWNQSYARVSLAPPATTGEHGEQDKWSRDPPMPRDSHLLSPWTQELLRLARSGKVGLKRKTPTDAEDEERPEEDVAGDDDRIGKGEDRAYVAKKWKPVPEHALVPEHLHWEFLAKRRKGLPSLYAPDLQSNGTIPMRKTKVQKVNAVTGDTLVYEVMVPEGQTIEGEIHGDHRDLADAQPVAAAPGTVIEGLGVANDEGILVAEHLKPASAPRRNRPPPKKKGGPGRGKKRVTFTNPDGSTYTTIVPNATKIVPQPGQTVKHVAKGEEATADITAEEAAAANAQHRTGLDVEEGDDGSDEGEDEDDEDDREEGELSEDDVPATATATPADGTPLREKVFAIDNILDTGEREYLSTATADPPLPQPAESSTKERDTSSSPELPLARQASASHSRHNSFIEPVVEAVPISAVELPVDETAIEQPLEVIHEQMEDVRPADDANISSTEVDGLEGSEHESFGVDLEARQSDVTGQPSEVVERDGPQSSTDVAAQGGEEDLLGGLEARLKGEGNLQQS